MPSTGPGRVGVSVCSAGPPSGSETAPAPTRTGKRDTRLAAPGASAAVSAGVRSRHVTLVFGIYPALAFATPMMPDAFQLAGPFVVPGSPCADSEESAGKLSDVSSARSRNADRSQRWSSAAGSFSRTISGSCPSTLRMRTRTGRWRARGGVPDRARRCAVAQTAPESPAFGRLGSESNRAPRQSSASPPGPGTGAGGP